jgi:hypothetical protein
MYFAASVIDNELHTTEAGFAFVHNGFTASIEVTS